MPCGNGHEPFVVRALFQRRHFNAGEATSVLRSRYETSTTELLGQAVRRNFV